ncbi:MAG: hypothetical protein IKL52_05845 [Candidatus Gastranaerophilales bacterium]|nr:hypothetical protein [Candidatus Gastranaerophilales bacterium]
MNGIKTLPDGDHCAYCNAKVNLSLYDFCPKCGNALSINALKFKNQQEKRTKIELLDELALELTDEKSLNIILNKVKSL